MVAHGDSDDLIAALDVAIDELVGRLPTVLIEETRCDHRPVMTESNALLARLLPPYAD